MVFVEKEKNTNLKIVSTLEKIPETAELGIIFFSRKGTINP